MRSTTRHVLEVALGPAPPPMVNVTAWFCLVLWWLVYMRADQFDMWLTTIVALGCAAGEITQAFADSDAQARRVLS